MCSGKVKLVGDLAYFCLHEWVDFDRKMETMMCPMLTYMLDCFPTYVRAVIDEEGTLSNLSERANHFKIVIRIEILD